MSFNSILNTHPEIIKDWDYANNKDLNPGNFSKTSKELVWWKCQFNHNYKVSIHSRIRSAGCKICNAPKKAENIRKSKLLKGKSFFDAKPELISEWNYSKNEIEPNEISEKSNIKVWFKCNKNHEWQSTPKRRSRGDGCPECYRLLDKSKLIREQKLKKKGLSLADEFPDLIKEWNFDKNDELPDKFASGSNQIVSWKCTFGHIWDATIYNRTGNLSGCPYCKASTSKLEVFILTEMRGLFKDVIWRYKINGYECDIYIPEIQTGIEVDGAFWHDDKLERDKLKFKVFKDRGVRLIRVRDKSLPKIEGEVILYNKQSVYIDLSCEVVKLLLITNSEIRLSDYVNQQIQIGNEEYKKILSLLPSPTEENSLSEINQKLAQEWDFVKNAPLTPFMFTPNSEKKVFWKCNDGHSWEATIKNRHLRNSGCPDCYKINISEIVRQGKLKKSTITFASLFPNLLSEWDFQKNKISPHDVAPKSKLKVWWICPNSHKYEKSIIGRANGNDCPDCSSKKRSYSARNIRILKTGTLDIKYPEIAKQWDFQKNNSNPSDFPPGSNSKVWWLCSNNHSWKTGISNRTKQSQGCPFCFKLNQKEISLKSAIKRLGSLEELKPSFLKEWDHDKNIDIKPSEITLNNKRKVWWLCSKNHSFSQSPNDRNGGHGCPTCSKENRKDSSLKSAIMRLGSLEEHKPSFLEEWDYNKNINVAPSDLTLNNKRKVWWLCSNNHSYSQSPSDRNRGHGCPTCSKQKKIEAYKLKILENRGSLETNKPDLLEYWDYIKNTSIFPNKVTLGSQEKAWWKCTNGHSWLENIKSISNPKRVKYCRFCNK
jgi:hypothetical protein